MTALFKSLNSVNQAVYMIIKQAPYMREEDYIPSFFSLRADSSTSFPIYIYSIHTGGDQDLREPPGR
jgi:hypothetical protein